MESFQKNLILKSIWKKTNEMVQDKPHKDDPDDEKGIETYEISINYAQDEKLWIINKIKYVDGMFSFCVFKEIDLENDNPDPKSILEC